MLIPHYVIPCEMVGRNLVLLPHHFKRCEMSVVVNAETGVLGYMTQAVRHQQLEHAVCTWQEHVLLKHHYPHTYRMLWCHNSMAMICIIQFTLIPSSPVVTIYSFISIQP